MAKHRKEVNADEGKYVRPERRQCSDASCDRNAGHERRDDKGHSIQGEEA